MVQFGLGVTINTGVLVLALLFNKTLLNRYYDWIILLQ